MFVVNVIYPSRRALFDQTSVCSDDPGTEPAENIFIQDRRNKLRKDIPLWIGRKRTWDGEKLLLSQLPPTCCLGRCFSPIFLSLFLTYSGFPHCAVSSNFSYVSVVIFFWKRILLSSKSHMSVRDILSWQPMSNTVRLTYRQTPNALSQLKHRHFFSVFRRYSQVTILLTLEAHLFVS